MADRVVRIESEVFVGVGRFTVDTCLKGELDQRLYWIQMRIRKPKPFASFILRNY